MALAKILQGQEVPNPKLPPVHIYVIKIREQENVLEWTFTGSNASPSFRVKNTVAAISDGSSVTKITLFEKFSNKIQEGGSYMMRGYVLRGQSPPYGINITKATQFFRGAALNVSEEIMAQGADLLDPDSPVVPLKDAAEHNGLLSIKGEVVEVSPVRKVRSGQMHVPLKVLKMREDGFTITVSLWRDAAVRQEVFMGDTVTISHLKRSPVGFELQLQSTGFTKIEKEIKSVRVTVLGVDEAGGGMVQLLTQELEKTILLDMDKWVFETELQEGDLLVDVTLAGRKILTIQKAGP